MTDTSDNHSLLLFRVGPVLCCAPSLPVITIIHPPKLTRPPGSDLANPGIFKHSGNIMSSLDLRFKFGVDQDQWVDPCRVIITQNVPGNVGFWVDEIQEVIETPGSGWGALPSLLPRGVFTQTLLLNKKIYLYSEFDKLFTIPTSGYLRGYIEHLLATETAAPAQQELNSTVISTAAISTAINSGSAEHENITRNQKSLPSRSTSSRVNSGESTRRPNDAIQTSVNGLNTRDNIEEPTVTVAAKNLVPTSEEAKQATAEKTIKSTTSDHSPLTDANKIKPVKSNSHVQNNNPTKTESMPNEVNPVAQKISKLTNQPDLTTQSTTYAKTNDASHEPLSEPEKVTATDSGKSSVIQTKVISSSKIENQPNPSLPEKHATPDKTSTTTSHPLTTKQTGNTTKKSSGTGTAMVIVLLVALIPGLVWYLSKSDDNKPQNKITMAKIINPDKTKHVNKTNHSEIIQSTTNKQAVATGEFEETHGTDQNEPSFDKNNNSLNISENEKSTQIATITEPPHNGDENDKSDEKNITEINSNDSTETNLSMDPVTQANPSQRIEAEPTTTSPGNDTELADYHADIQSDDDGITIILEVPEETLVFKTETPSDVVTPSKPENDSLVSASTPNDVDIELRIEKNQTTSDNSARSKANPVAQLEATDSKTNPNKRPGTVLQTEITHIVVKGDTLWHIAIRYVNNPYKYPELARLSNIKNPDLIYPGNRVRIIKKIRQAR